MPFIDERRIVQNLTNVAPPDEPPLEPSLMETFGAAFRTENVVGSYLSSRGIPDPYEIEEDFNAIDYVKDDPDFAPYVTDFAGIFNKKAADAQKLQIVREKQDRRTIDAAGGMGVVASMAAGVFDLPTLLPVGGGLMGAGSSIARTAAGAAIGAGIDATVSEAGLQVTQRTRTGEETAFNIGGSILLGGALGTLVGRYLSTEASSALSRKIENQERGYEEFDTAFASSGSASSAGAAARDVGPLALKDEKLIRNLPGISKQDPLIRLQLSQFDAARSTVRGLAETPLEYADNASGVATEIGGSVETRMKMWQAPLASSLRDIDTTYAKYFNNAPVPTAWQTRLSPIKSEFQRLTGGNKLTYKQFKEEVGKAAFSGQKHAIPEVEEAARTYRQFDDAMKQAAIEAKLLPEDIKVAKDASHLFRMYNKEKIIANRSGWGKILFGHFESGRIAAADRLSEMEAAKLAVQVEKAQGTLVSAEDRLSSIVKRGTEASTILDNRILDMEQRDVTNRVTPRMEEARLRKLDEVNNLRSEYKSANAIFAKAKAELDGVKAAFDALPDEVKTSKRVQMALDYHKQGSSLLARKAEISRLREKQLGYRLSGQDAKVLEIDKKIHSIEPEIAQLEKNISRLKDVFSKIGKGTDSEIEELSQFSRLLPDEVQEIVEEVTDQILGNAEGRIPYDSIVSGPRGALKARALKIESSKIQDFMELDIEHVLHAQTRTMSADVELAKKFGSVDLAEEIRKVNDEANRKIANVDGRTDIKDAAKEKARTKLEKQRKRAIADIEGIRDRLRGQYALPSNPDGLVIRAGRVARNLNYLRLLGGMTISALPDMAGVIMKHGLTSTFRDGFIPLVTNFRAFRAAADEVKQAGTALDMILDSRAMSLADITGDYGRNSKFERGIQSLSSRFGVSSLMAPWNASMKQFSGLIVMTNVLKAAERVAKGQALKGDVRKLAAGGINADLAQRIFTQFTQHGDNQAGVLLAKAGNWTDRQAIDAFRTAVVRDVDRIIVTPGQDKPLWMSTELGKTIGQFRTFGISAMQRTMLAGLQQRDAATLNGAMVALGLGAMSYWAKQNIAGKDVSDNPVVWAVEAFDKSGITGWLMDANNIAEKATRGTVGLSAITGEQVTRYASRNITGAILGPTPDAIADIFQVSGAVFAGDATKSDLKKVRQLVPFQNLFYLRSLFNQVEEATGQALDLPDTRK